MKASRKIWSRTCTSQVHFPVNIFLIAVYYLCLRFRIAHWLFRIINITMFYVYKNVFALQNTEHGPVERGVFTHNDHIIEQIIIIIINIIIWQWKYHRNGRKAITSIRLSLKPWKPTMIKKNPTFIIVCTSNLKTVIQCMYVYFNRIVDHSEPYWHGRRSWNQQGRHFETMVD